MNCFFDLPPPVRRELVDFKDGVARQFWMGRVENEFFTKGVSRCHFVLGFIYNMRTPRSEHCGGASGYCNLPSPRLGAHPLDYLVNCLEKFRSDFSGVLVSGLVDPLDGFVQAREIGNHWPAEQQT